MVARTVAQLRAYLHVVFARWLGAGGYGRYACRTESLAGRGM
jgi:hypothetical protein